jgi:hypothetical protein
LGGNLSIFKWLAETLFCPIDSTRRKTTLLSPRNLNIVHEENVLTLQEKSVLDLAMETQELGILYYLIIEKKVNVMQYRNLNVTLRAFVAALRHLPDHLKKSNNA